MNENEYLTGIYIWPVSMIFLTKGESPNESKNKSKDKSKSELLKWKTLKL